MASKLKAKEPTAEPAVVLQANSVSAPHRTTEPAPCCLHQTAVVRNKVYLWGGDQDNLPEGHENKAKMEFLSKVYSFDLKTGSWICDSTIETPPLGCIGYACVAVDEDIYYFGGECGHDDCCHSTLHRLHVPSKKWLMLASYLTRSGSESKEIIEPMQKGYSGMVAFKASDRSDALLVVGGLGSNPPPARKETDKERPNEPKAEYVYEEIHFKDELMMLTNEQHIFSLGKDKWILPEVIGEAPPPLLYFSLSSIGNNKAALFGGKNNSCSFNDIMIVEFELTINDQLQEKDKVKGVLQWTKISHPADSHRVMWPLRRSGHAASFLPNHNALLIVGGEEKGNTLCDDSWVYEFGKQIWKKVTFSTEKITKRQFHSLCVFSPTKSQGTVLMTFGGLITNSSCWLRTTAVPVQEHSTIIFELVANDGQWERTILLEGSALSRSMIFMQNNQVLQELQTENESLKSELQKAHSDHSKLKEEATKKVAKFEEENEQLQALVAKSRLECDQTKIKLSEVEREKVLFQKQAKELGEKFERLCERMERERQQQLSDVCNRQTQSTPIKVDERVLKVSVHATDEPTVANLVTQIANEIPTKWFDAGIQLDIKKAQLDQFETQHKLNSVRLWTEVFDQWKREQKRPYTWETIICVLDSIGENKTAAQIRKWIAKN